jgi:hypothetical protein
MFSNCPTPPLKKYVNLKGLPNKKCPCMRFIDTACMIFAFKNRSYIGKFEAEFKKALAGESGAQGILFDEKNRRSKYHDTVSLTTTNN